MRIEQFTTDQSPTITLQRGEAIILRWRVLPPAQSIAGWNFTFTVAETRDDTPWFTQNLIGSGTDAIDVTITSSATAGRDVPASDRDVAPPGANVYDLWRTDSGEKRRLASGVLLLNNSQQGK